MINTIEFVTTSGVKAVIKERLTFGEKRRVQKILMSKITVDTITKEGATSVKKATADIALEYQDAMTEVALVSTEVDGRSWGVKEDSLCDIVKVIEVWNLFVFCNLIFGIFFIFNKSVNYYYES
jgi:hypothetical protein